jgi:hypothetical protein
MTINEQKKIIVMIVLLRCSHVSNLFRNLVLYKLYTSSMPFHLQLHHLSPLTLFFSIAFTGTPGPLIFQFSNSSGYWQCCCPQVSSSLILYHGQGSTTIGVPTYHSKSKKVVSILSNALWKMKCHTHVPVQEGFRVTGVSA